jgi:hypothetical protein
MENSTIGGKETLQQVAIEIAEVISEVRLLIKPIVVQGRAKILQIQKMLGKF